MANKYANLVGTNKIKDEYTKINTGFDAVETDIANHGTAADPHDQYALDTDLATLQTEVEAHTADNVHYHVRTATVIVAAYDSKYKQFADFVSSGGDDGTLIMSARNSLPENGGKIVLLDGTYNVNTTLQILGRNIWLAGSGANTILKSSSSVRPEGVNMMLSDMVIDFDGDDTRLQIEYGNSQILKRLTIKNSTLAGFLSVDNITIDNCKFENNITHLRINSSNTLITNCRFSGYIGTGKGIFIYLTAADTIITNCYIDALRDAGTNTVVANNIIREA